MNRIDKTLVFSLQLFAEGGSDGAGTGVSSAVPGQSEGDLSDVVYGKQEIVHDANAQNAVVDRDAEFEKLIKGEYKEQYGKRMQDTINKRLKSSKETVDKYNALSPTLEMLGKKYGVDASDIEALNKAILEDDSYYEEEALEKGITVEQLKSIRKMERENADLKRQMREADTRAQADRIYAGWMNESEKLREVYPTFDLATEMQNPRFTDLLKNNIDVKTAYEVLHKDEIIPAAMQFTAQTVRQKVVNDIMANGQRPVENGMRSQSATVMKTDVSMLTKADREEIIRRVQRGERIRF